jgi:uncharacterized protein (DUF697 family)
VFICFVSLVIDVCGGIVVAEASIATGMEFSPGTRTAKSRSTDGSDY